MMFEPMWPRAGPAFANGRPGFAKDLARPRPLDRWRMRGRPSRRVQVLWQALVCGLIDQSTGDSASAQVTVSAGLTGCGRKPPVKPGASSVVKKFGSKKLRKNYPNQIWPRRFAITVPPQYDSTNATAVVLAFHGWSGQGETWSNILGETAALQSFILVAPTGADDITGDADPTQWTSFNGGGTTQVPFTMNGRTCDVKKANEPTGNFCNQTGPPWDNYCSYCYKSCAARVQGCKPCDWTTCNDDFVFVGLLLDWMEENFCVDPSRVYATGFSNGATFVYALGQALAHRIAAIGEQDYGSDTHLTAPHLAHLCAESWMAATSSVL